MQITLKRLSINLAENKNHFVPYLNIQKTGKVSLSTKLIIFETPVIRNENIIESFCLRKCGRLGNRCRSVLVKLRTISYYGDFHIMPMF